MFWFLAVVCFLGLFCESCVNAQTMPQPTFEACKPKGFILSIPDHAGFSFLSFHANINEVIEVLEAGSMSGNVTRSVVGKWFLIDREIKLKVGDTMYYWFYAIMDKQRYFQTNGEWTVTELLETHFPLVKVQREKSELARKIIEEAYAIDTDSELGQPKTEDTKTSNSQQTNSNVHTTLIVLLLIVCEYLLKK